MMDFEAIVKTLKLLTYKDRKDFFKVTTVYFGDDRGFDIEVNVNVKDRTTGEDDVLWTHYTYCPREVPYMKPANVVKRVKTMLQYLETHEVEEQLLYRGMRVFDPHNTVLRGPNVQRERENARQEAINESLAEKS